MSDERLHIRRAFAGAAASYDAAAVVQREAGLRLLAGLPADASPGRVIDLGCGTGHGLTLLGQRWPGTQLIGLDFALPMLRRLPELDRYLSICADAEATPLRDATADLVWSNLTLQWCEPRRFCAEAARLLRRGGRLTLSTLGPDTFAELRLAFAGVDGYRHTLDFAAPATLAEAIGAAGLRLLGIERVALTRRHPGLRDLLGEVRDIGANRVGGDGARRRGLMGKAAWRQFEAAYERQRDGDGLPLTYDLLFLYAEK